MAVAKKEFTQTVEKIAQSPEYKFLQLKNKISDWGSRLAEKLADWFLQQSQEADLNLPTAWINQLADLLLVLGTVVLIIGFIFIVLKIGSSFRGSREVEEILGKKIDEDTTPYSLKEKAGEFSRQGDLRRAIRYEFIALLYLMHQESILYLDETKTNQEIYRYLDKDNFFGLANLEQLISIFNATWYGHRSCDNETYDQWTDNLNQLWNEVAKDEE